MAKTIAAMATPYLAFRRALPLLAHSPKPSFILFRRTSSATPIAIPKLHRRCHFPGGTSTETDGGFFRCGFARKLSTSTRASQVNDAGSIDSPLMQSMQSKIKEQLSAESVTVKDAYGDGRHVSIDVVSSAFEGQSAVNRQRMVYKAIWEELQSTVHAVDQMTTRTPREASGQK